MKNNFIGLFVLGIFISLGAFILSSALLEIKEKERTVVVKGLSEREYDANVITWPISYNVVNNDLNELYISLKSNAKKIKTFLIKNGVNEKEISSSAPIIEDKYINSYGNNKANFRYSGKQSITVHSSNVLKIKSIMELLSELGQQGVTIVRDYEHRTSYSFTKLNDIKPEMIEEATKNARKVAEKFAKDSQSTLGKIKKANQGTFSIYSKDYYTPEIKNVRVVSTIEYYLSD
ncbi:MAG: PUTATIVE PERIPLASMIC PROTEIN [uncultured Campylobacterales bacterium]|uniref:PUTATIVE PERIPLASMIC PROTEIN n=1 Tax=uncultured Campylobacterales bacterium TaxID=352960 RepID=A0A6S6S8W4_9BACT|nr:MAG: PUTATIVE PERIPLASMIC PROTEIN [uncultured Campylobacterales bacterium]